MNSSYGKSNNKTGAFDFDLGLGSGGSRPMNQTSPYSSTTYTYPAAQQKPTTTSSWTHQPAPSVQSGLPGSLSGPTTMVGDIYGRSWGSSAPPISGASAIGIVNNKNPNLFGDLVSSAMGQNKGNNNVPLKNAAPVTSQNTFSMGSMADSLPKTNYSGTTSSTWGSNSTSSGGNVDLGGNYNKSSGFGGSNVKLGGNNNGNPNLGGPSMRSMAGSGLGGGAMGSSKDPFGSLVDFGSKSPPSMNSASKTSGNSGFEDDSFGDFQNATAKSSGSSFSSGASPTNIDPFGDFGFSSNIPGNQSQPPKQSSGPNDFDALFSTSGGGGGTEGFASQQFSEGDNWGINSEFGGNDSGGTTELEGLPPPPTGVSAPSAKSKGMDNYKQGQFADAIKWLSWAVVLLEKAGDDDGAMEVLTSRASCYKEVGEYKKAVADCSKVLECDANNISVLVQRALLYESMEKYKLGAEDLRTVMKLDPGNRVARSTIHRLIKMAE